MRVEQRCGGDFDDAQCRACTNRKRPRSIESDITHRPSRHTRHSPKLALSHIAPLPYLANCGDDAPRRMRAGGTDNAHDRHLHGNGFRSAADRPDERDKICLHFVKDGCNVRAHSKSLHIFQSFHISSPP
jgi:hypothetical protein